MVGWGVGDVMQWEVENRGEIYELTISGLAEKGLGDG